MYTGKITDDMICAQSVFQEVDVYQGFSVAPLMVPDVNGRLAVLGLVSWGEGCARKNRPTVYTNVTKHIDWIRLIIGTLPFSQSETLVFPDKTQTPPPGLHVSPRIVSPEPNMTFQTYLWIVSIEKSDLPPADGHFCGGVLINKH